MQLLIASIILQYATPVNIILQYATPVSIMLLPRYLAESGCVGMCVNLCKAPTQEFFTEQLGMPLTMEPSKS